MHIYNQSARFDHWAKYQVYVRTTPRVSTLYINNLSKPALQRRR